MKFLPEPDAGVDHQVEMSNAKPHDHFVEVIEEFETCESDDAILALLKPAAESLGATCSYFAAFERAESKPESFSLLLACDPLWGLEYERAGCFASDPWVAYSRANSAPITADEIASYPEASMRVVDLAASFGFRSVIVAPAPATGAGGSLGMLVLGHQQRGYFERPRRLLERMASRTLAMAVHERRATVARHRLLSTASLSVLEVNLLRMARQGLSSKAIGKATGLSAPAVDMRFHRLNRRLQCSDRKSAARLAAQSGII